MKAVYCPYCGGRTKRNGRTSSGSQRWRCTACGASTTVRYDDTAARLDEFLGWLLSKDSQAAMPGGGRSFRRRTAEFWEVWPMPVPDGELHRVLHVDGIRVARDLVVLICCSGERVVSWYMARSENSSVSVNLFFTSFAKQAHRSRKGGFTGCANVFSPIPVTA